MIRALLASVVLLPFMACTLLVGVDPLAEPAPCAGAGDCIAGFVCTDAVCIESSGGTSPPSCDSLAALDFVVAGPEGSSIVVDPGALAGSTCLPSSSGSTSSLVPGRRLVAPAATFGEAGQTLMGAALVRFQVTDADCAAGLCSVWRLDDEWVELSSPPSTTDGGAAAGIVAGRTTRLGTFAATAPLATPDAGSPDAGSADAGPLDAGFDAGADAGSTDAGQADAGQADAGQTDAGQTDAGVPLFASCAFDPSSCGAGRTCVPDPFDPEVGVCTQSCVVGQSPAACASCGAVTSLEGTWCRPSSWSGTVLAGGACTADTDCDPATTNGCVDFGGGALTCAASCDPGDATACGAGCCSAGQSAAGAGAAGAFCRASASCSQPDGTACLTAAECAGNACEAVLDTVARCTSTCTVTASACGAGLCCAPVDCQGEGRCVAAETCEAAASELFCNALCVGDDACGANEYCVDGSCEDLGACECLRTEHCGAAEYCRIDSPDGGGAPPCGVCTALPATVGSCFADGNCPNAAAAPNVLCRPASGCAGDPLGQCEGTCEALAAGQCVSAADCVGDQVCVANECR